MYTPHPVSILETLGLVIQTSPTSLLTCTSLCVKTGVLCLRKQGLGVGYSSISYEPSSACASFVIPAGAGVTEVIIQSKGVAYKRGSFTCQGWHGERTFGC